MKDIEFLTTKEYSQRFKVSLRTIHRMIGEKTINAIDLNNHTKQKAIWRILVNTSEYMNKN